MSPVCKSPQTQILHSIKVPSSFPWESLFLSAQRRTCCTYVCLPFLFDRQQHALEKKQQEGRKEGKEERKDRGRGKWGGKGGRTEWRKKGRRRAREGNKRKGKEENQARLCPGLWITPNIKPTFSPSQAPNSKDKATLHKVVVRLKLLYHPAFNTENFKYGTWHSTWWKKMSHDWLNYLITFFIFFLPHNYKLQPKKQSH